MGSIKVMFFILWVLQFVHGLPEGCTSRLWSGMQVTDCSNIGLRNVPSTLPRNTEILFLEGNAITSLRNVSWDLPRLTHLDLTNVSWTGLPFLETRSLYGNKITSLNGANWTGLTSLIYLQLEYNNISSFQEANWFGLTSLTHLFLDNNNITSLNGANWTGLTSLTNLDLENNNIASFQEANWYGLTSLKNLDIEGNPAAKDCDSSICLLYSIGKANTTIDGISHCNIIFCEARPRVSVLSRTYNVSTGEDVTLECTVMPVRLDEDQINKVTWLHNNKSINTEISKYTLGTVPNPSLTISSVQLEDEGTYTCVAQTSHGFLSESDKIQLNVETARPRVSVLSITYNVSTGEDVTLECTVMPVRLDEDQINKVTWLHNNKSINTEISKYTLGTVPNPSLTISSVQLEDEGTYTCAAQTSHGFLSESDKIQLNVETARLRVSVLSRTYNVSTGEDVTLKCTMMPVRLAEDQINKVTWLHNNKSINTEISKYTLGTVPNPSLTITSVQLEDEGTYTCVAQTSHGFLSESDTIQLNVETAYAPNEIWYGVGGGGVGLLILVFSISVFVYIMKRKRQQSGHAQPSMSTEGDYDVIGRGSQHISPYDELQMSSMSGEGQYHTIAIG